MNIKVPIDHRFLIDPSQEETFKQFTGLKIDKRITHYTCLCNCFMLFVSDQEIDCKNSKMLNAFRGKNNIEKLRSMNLPMASYSTNNKNMETNTDEVKQDFTGNLCFEIDLKYIKQISKSF